MAMKKPCNRCKTLIDVSNKNGYCDECWNEVVRKEREQNRGGSARERGYNSKWDKYSKRFLAKPENAFCSYRFEGCNIFSQCVDHIEPPSGPNDPLFWNTKNHTAACLHCNSIKRNKRIEPKFKP